MQKGLVSIITPTYNHEKFLASCLDSVIAQSYTNWEVIIIDDGSPDNTGKIGRNYSSRFPNITYIYQDNVGPYRLHETYNKALALAKGEFIAILEGDDFWYPNKLELQMQSFNQHPDAILSWGRAKSVYAESLEVIREHPTKDKDRNLFDNNPPGKILKQLYVNNCIPALTIIFRAEPLRSIGGFGSLENLPLVDYPTLLELSLIGPFAYVDEFLGAWRMYPQQVTKTHTVNIKKGLQEYARQHYHKHLKSGNEALEKLDWNYIQNQFKDFMIIAHARAGRYRLIHGDYSGARKDYIKALSIGFIRRPKWKIRAMVGFIFSLLHLNVEGVAKLFKKTSYQK